MNKTMAVARWEYVEKIKSKAFLVSLVLMPIIMIGFGVIPTLFASRPDTETKVIGVVDPSGEMAMPLSAYLDEHFQLPDGRPNYVIEPLTSGRVSDLTTAKANADSLVYRGRMEGYLLFPDSGREGVEYKTQNVGNIKVTERLLSALRDVVVERMSSCTGMPAPA